MFENLKNTNIITIEGCDGSGKSLISTMIQKQIPDSLLISFPNYQSLSGHRIKQILTKKVPHPGELEFQSLQLSDKIATLHTINLYDDIPQTLIFCRYVESSYVYGKANEEVPLQFLVNINSVLPQSDIVFVLHGKNYGKHSDYYETDTLQQKVSDLYLQYAQIFNWHVINNNKTPKEIVDEILLQIKVNCL